MKYTTGIKVHRIGYPNFLCPASDLISQNSKPSVLQSKVSSLTVPFASKFFLTLPNPYIEPIQEFGNMHEN